MSCGTKKNANYWNYGSNSKNYSNESWTRQSCSKKNVTNYYDYWNSNYGYLIKKSLTNYENCYVMNSIAMNLNSNANSKRTNLKNYASWNYANSMSLSAKNLSYGYCSNAKNSNGMSLPNYSNSNANYSNVNYSMNYETSLNGSKMNESLIKKSYCSNENWNYEKNCYDWMSCGYLIQKNWNCCDLKNYANSNYGLKNYEKMNCLNGWNSKNYLTNCAKNLSEMNSNSNGYWSYYGWMSYARKKNENLKNCLTNCSNGNWRQILRPRSNRRKPRSELNYWYRAKLYRSKQSKNLFLVDSSSLRL